MSQPKSNRNKSSRPPTRHWKERDAERTLCGRVPKGHEVDPSWPLCKTCDRLSEFYPTTYTLPAPTGQSSGNPAGEGAKFSVLFTQMTVQRLRKKPRRKAS